jgi:dTDP-4-dehydrorhamnose 3,5-epimerase
MKFQSTQIAGVWLIEPERLYDERGYFARTLSQPALAEHGLPTAWPESSVAFNRLKHTVRGMHWQAMAPGDTTGEHKLVRCTRGAACDCVVDVRPESSTFGHWQFWELSADNCRTLHIPPCVAHGYLTLTDDCELSYQMSAEYVPELSRGVRWDDPKLNIAWPAKPQVISSRDRALPFLFDVLSHRPNEVVA